MSKTSSQTCSSCAKWGTSFRLASKKTTCSELGFEPTDTCGKWVAKTRACVVRVKEPTLAEILDYPEIRKPWTAFRRQLEASAASYNEAEGSYYFEFDDEQQANKHAARLSKEEYVKIKHGFVMPLKSVSVPEGSVTLAARATR